LIHSEAERVIFDYANPIVLTNGTITWDVARTEGGPPASEPQVNAAYDYIGAAYALYRTYHGRTEWNPDSPKIRAWVRYCPSSNECPWGNAEYDSFYPEMHFGNGWAADDVVAHEYTHGITDFESNLIYRNTPGAINESFSDIWGEFVDLVVVYSNDVASARWLLSEDVPGGPIRSMKDPTLFNDPDRLNSPFYVPPPSIPNQDNDYGGVHSNSGVLNKFCYLLTDGDYFNGYSIAGMGIHRVADLLYELNANLLQSAPDWGDVYDALRQAAVNLNWTKIEQDNLCRAALAIEIALRPRNFYVDKGSLGCITTGSQICTLFGGPYISVAQGVSEIFPGDNLWVRTGSYNEKPTIARSLTLRPYDGPVSIGKP
jgi:Zn-dependent metalloprotease